MSLDPFGGVRIPGTLGDDVLHALSTYIYDQITVVLTFAGRVDDARLARALRLTLDAEPVLGCRFWPGRWRSSWERLPDVETREHLEMVEVTDSEAFERGVDAFVALPDTPDGAVLLARLLRGPTDDRLCLRVRHVAADAGGAKEVAYLVAACYRALGDDPAWRPTPNLGGRRTYAPLFEPLTRVERRAVTRASWARQRAWLDPPR